MPAQFSQKGNKIIWHIFPVNSTEKSWSGKWIDGPPQVEKTMVVGRQRACPGFKKLVKGEKLAHETSMGAKSALLFMDTLLTNPCQKAQRGRI